MDRVDTAPVRAAGTRPETTTGRQRVIVERIQPEIDGGRFPIKRTVGEVVHVTADLFADGDDRLAGVVKYRKTADPAWNEVPLVDLGHDRWGGAFTVTQLGVYEYTVEGWVDQFGSWLKGLVAKAEAGQDVSRELVEGAELVHGVVRLKPDTPHGEPDQAEDEDDQDDDHQDDDHQHDDDQHDDDQHDDDQHDDDQGVVSGFSRTEDDLQLLEFADILRSGRPLWARVAAARDAGLAALMARRHDRSQATVASHVWRVTVDPVRARFSAWYEMFPRSATSDLARSGTFREAEAQLPGIAAMGFDVLYLPPIHPIGRTHRKGRNNSLTPESGDPGSPWAIGAAEGGHTAIEPGLGTLADFDRFVSVARRLRLEVALDIAFQASPDHPWVREHPEWFRHGSDGSITYAENPPKKYQDIYPLNFDSHEWPALWAELRDVFLFWVAHGVRTFRVDNPHTKAFPFWEWVIAAVQREHPDTVFLAEAFTRPTVMRYLAKCGFSQSYTYFTWHNDAAALRHYLTELTTTELQEYMRPNFFANTPDILHEFLQSGGPAAFELRLTLAATLAASYGIYSGYELFENQPARPGSEEYLDSEKYQFRPRDWNQAGPMRELIARINQIRRRHPALQQNATLAFHATDNGAFLFYSKVAPGPARDRVFVVANHDVHWMQHGWVQLPIWELGIPPRTPYVVEDLLDGARYTWRGDWNYVKLDPRERVAHILVVRP